MTDGIVDYLILEGKPNELQKQVGSRLDEGWVPLGGVAVAASLSAHGELEYVFAQAMVRSAANKKKLSMTVPMATISESGSDTTVSIPSVFNADSLAACPHCQIAIRIRTLKNGTNRCEKCLREFEVDLGDN